MMGPEGAQPATSVLLNDDFKTFCMAGEDWNTAAKSRKVFAPAHKVFASTVAVEQSMKAFMPTSRLGEVSEPVLERMGANGDKHGEGAMYSFWVTTVQLRKKGGSSTTRQKVCVTLTKAIPVDTSGRATVEMLVETAALENQPGSRQTVAIDIRGVSEQESEVDFSLTTSTPTCVQTFPKVLCILPCFWPHLVVFTVMCFICMPCTVNSRRNESKSQLRDAIEYSMDGLKRISEKGPTAEVMTDKGPAGLPAGYSEPPPAYAPDAGKAGAGAGAGAAVLGFCPKCGTPRTDTGMAFCAKCGHKCE